MKLLKYFLCALNALFLFLLVILVSVEIPSQDRIFYEHEYEKNEVYDAIGIDYENLAKVTEKIRNYLKGAEDELNLTVEVGGENRFFFNEKEIKHMEDVRYLFDMGYLLKYISLAVLASTFFLLYYLFGINTGFGTSPYRGQGFLRELFKTYLFVFIAAFVIIAVLVLIISRDFMDSFMAFHEIFFDNDLYILDYRTDLLINIVPTRFFIDISLYMLSIIIFLSAVIMTVSAVYLKKHKSYLRVVK